GLRTVVLRMSSIYGPRQFATFSQGWVSWFIFKALEGKAFTIHGDGKQVRDLLHVSDLTKAFVKCASDDKAWGQIFNIGGGPESSLSLVELFATLEERLSINLDYEKKPPRPADQKVYISDIRKLHQIVNWVPQTKIKDGIEQQIDWVQKHLALLQEATAEEDTHLKVK
ncbi:MAG: NAD-dependent epimerase/dehydratase family protein, partial [Pseudomonadota bacterium]